MRLSKWIGLSAAIGLVGLVATPGVQSAIRARLKGRVDPRAVNDAPAAVAYGQARDGAALGTSAPRVDAAAVTAARSRIATIESAQQGVVSGLAAMNAEVLYRLKRAYNGVSIRVDARQLDAIRALPGVKAVHRMVPKQLQNWNSVPFIGAPTVWTSGLGHTGTGIKVGVIDTGVDYLHSNFGGPGAAADYHGLN